MAERVVVGLNRFRREGQAEDVGETFRADPKATQWIVEKFNKVRDGRDNAAADRNLAALSDAAAGDNENLLPYLVDCCHAYVTVGEMVAALKRHWGEFQEPVRF